jgi:polysaccharide pyruvyl transferase CsaB
MLSSHTLLRPVLESKSPACEPQVTGRKLPKQRALLMGYYGVGNLGDEMMLVCLKQWLERQGFDLTVLSEKPARVVQTHGLPAVENSPLLGEWAWRSGWLKGGALRVVRALASSDVLIVGGGDLIRDDLGWRTFFFTMEKIVAAILMGKKVFLVNMGIGQLSTRYGRALLKWTLRRCQRIIVRDARSEQMCRELGVTEQVTLAPDIVLSLPDLLGHQRLTNVGSPHKSPYMLVCLRHNPETFHGYEMTEARIRTLAHSLDALIERHNVDVVFLPLHAATPNGRGDASLHGRVAKAMVHAERIQLRPWTADLNEVCSWISDAQLVLAMRLHAAVLAHSYGRPCVLMPYDRKVQEFGELMAIRHSIEAATLDEVAAMDDVFESAWREPQPEHGRHHWQHTISSMWADLTLERAS